MHGTDRYPDQPSIIWAVGPNGWESLCKRSGSGLKSCCSHVTVRFHTCFEQGIPWHSGNYRLWIQSERRSWHQKNMQSDAPYRYVLRKQPSHLGVFAKCLSVGLRTKWFLVRVQLQSLNLQISCLLGGSSSLTFRQPTKESGFTLKRVRDMTRTYSEMHSTERYSQDSRMIWPVRPIGWLFVYEESGSESKSRCSHLTSRFCGCFEQGVLWHSGNYRVWIHSETRTWLDKNIQWSAPYIVVLKNRAQSFGQFC